MVCLEGYRARGRGEAGHGEREGTRRARGRGGPAHVGPMRLPPLNNYPPLPPPSRG